MSKNNLFPNIPGPEYECLKKMLSYAFKHVEIWVSAELAIEYLTDMCKHCSIDDCNCDNQEIIEILTKALKDE